MAMVILEPYMNDNATTDLLRYTKALVLLQLQSLTESEPVKPEVLLSRVGLSAREIAEMLGKNPGAVAKAIQRAEKGGV
jgi:DNA-directed RNA polymerase specialized sigma24 family protein